MPHGSIITITCLFLVLDIVPLRLRAIERVVLVPRGDAKNYTLQ